MARRWPKWHNSYPASRASGAHPPNEDERFFGAQWNERVNALLDKLIREEGFGEDEAVTFVAGVCWEYARANGLKRWATRYGCKRTILRFRHADATTLDWVMEILSGAIPSVEGELTGAREA